MAFGERRGIDHEPDLTAAEAFVCDRVHAYTSRNPRPIPTEFSHVARSVAVADEGEAIRLRKKFRFSGTERGFLIEEALPFLAEGANWFGESSFVFATTDYDDLKNGVDGIIEVAPGVRAAFDVASGTSSEGLREKISKIYSGGNVRYFRSEMELDEDGDPTEMGLSNLPFIVIGMDPLTFGSLSEAIYVARKETKRRDPQTNEMLTTVSFDQRVLENYPVKALLLEQARAQLRVQRQNPQAMEFLAHVEKELDKIKGSPEFRRAAVIGRQSPTHRGLTLAG